MVMPIEEPVPDPEEQGLGPMAAAVLEFTTPAVGALRPHNDILYLTSKDSWIWGALAAKVAEQGATQLSNLRITSTVYYTLMDFQGRGFLNTANAPYFNNHVQGIVNEHGSNSLSLDLFSKVATALLSLNTRSYLDGPFSEDIIAVINREIGVTYKALLEDALITDPVIETALGVAFLSMVPFSFVRKTTKGQTVYLKLQAALWKYELQKQAGGKRSVSITLEAARIAKVLKVALVAGYHQATGAGGDEPPLPPTAPGDEPE